MAIQEVPVDVRFGAVDQREGQKYLVPGQLDLAQNVVQVEDGIYEKRDGYEAVSYEDAPPGTRDGGLVAGRLAEVSADAVYVHDGADAMVRRTRYEPAFATHRTVMTNYGFRPVFVTDDLGQTWYFSADQLFSDGEGFFSTSRHPAYKVEDASGREIVAAQTFTTGPVKSHKAETIGSKVYYFALDTLGIRLAVFDTANPGTTPALSYFYVGTNLTGFDICRSPADGIAVAIWGTNVAGAGTDVAITLLDTVTDAPGFAFVGHDTGRPGALYPGAFFKELTLDYWVMTVALDGASSSARAIAQIFFDRSTFAATTKILIDGITIATSAGSDQLGGCIRPDGKWETYWTGAASVAIAPTDSVLRRYTYHAPSDTLSNIDQELARGVWLVSDPTIVNGEVFLVLGHDDVYSTFVSPVLGQQRSYSLFDVENREVRARAMYEAGGGDRGHLAGTFSGSDYEKGWIAPVRVTGSVIELAINRCSDGLRYFDTVLLSWDLAPTLGPPVAVGDTLVLPGGLPKVVTSWGHQELAPVLSPPDLVVSAQPGGTSYAGTFQVCATYVIVSPDDREIESAPSVIRSVTVAAGFIRAEVPILNWTSGGQVFIRVFSTTDAGTTLYRQAQIPNGSGVYSTTIDLQSISVGPPLYTEGSVPENAPPPPFRVAASWDQRLFVSDTAEEGYVYPSRFIKQGLLPAFVDDFKFYVGARIRAMCPVDRNYLAIFHEGPGGISVIQTGGPSDNGANFYQPIHLAVLQSTENPRSVVSTPWGCLFQGRDGGIYLLDRSLQVSFIGRGVDDHRSATITSAVYLEKEQRALFTTDNQQVLVFDFSRKSSIPTTPEEALGQWYVWPLDTTTAPVAGIVKDGAHHILAASGTIWRQVDGRAYDGAATFIGMKVRVPLSFQGVSSFLRCLRGVVVSQWVGDHRIQLTIETDGTSTVLPAKDILAGTRVWDFRPNPSKASHFVLTIEEQQHETALNKGFRFEGLGFLVQRQPGIVRGTTRLG